MTDPLSDQPPLSEEYLRSALERAEDATPEPCEVIALARECLRLRGLLAEAAGALGPFLSEHARFTHELAEGGENCHVYCAGCECEEAQEKAAAMAARVRGHLGGGQG